MQAHSFTFAGRLDTRQWVRGATTTYAYDALDQGLLASVTYSVGTPAVTVTVQINTDPDHFCQTGIILLRPLGYEGHGRIFVPKAKEPKSEGKRVRVSKEKL